MPSGGSRGLRIIRVTNRRVCRHLSTPWVPVRPCDWSAGPAPASHWLADQFTLLVRVKRLTGRIGGPVVMRLICKKFS